MHENVPGFDTSIIEEAFSPEYTVLHLFVDPADVGFAFVRRRRVYTIAFHSGRVAMKRDIRTLYRAVANKLSNEALGIVASFIASEADLLEEETGSE